MTENNILSRQNTLWMQGVSALLIMLMHFVMQLESYPRFSIFLVALLLLYSYLSLDLVSMKAIKPMVSITFGKEIPSCNHSMLDYFLFQLPFVEHFDSVQLLKNLTFYDSGLWFVDYIIRWYLVYWICRRFFTKTRNTFFLFLEYIMYSSNNYIVNKLSPFSVDT